MSDDFTPTTLQARMAYTFIGFDSWLAAHDADVWDEGQKSGLRYTDRMRAAYEMGRPELPGPPSENPYRQGSS